MRVFTVLLCMGLLFSTVQAANNVEIHFNYPADTVYVGVANKLEIWIENDVTITGKSLALEFSGYAGQVDWNGSYGNRAPLNEENDAFEAFPGLAINYGNLYDNYLPDSILFGGIVMIPAEIGLEPGSMRLCYSMMFTIPAGESEGSICVDNIFYPPAGEWLFYQRYGPEFAPEFNGCSNTATYIPDCDAVCFPVAIAPAPVAEFSFSPDSGDYPLDVDFFDYSTNYPTEWHWLFGDGGSSSEQNPTHTYTFAGIFFPLLIVTNSSGTDTLVSPDAITVTTPQAPVGVTLTCPDTKETYGGVTDTILYVVDNNTEYPGDFNFMASDSLGWFMSPTFYQFHMDAYTLENIYVEVLVPASLGIGVQNKITGSVVLQTNPMITDTAICRMIIIDGICGDVNLDGMVNVSDAVYLINYVFNGGPSPCEQSK